MVTRHEKSAARPRHEQGRPALVWYKQHRFHAWHQGQSKSLTIGFASSFWSKARAPLDAHCRRSVWWPAATGQTVRTQHKHEICNDMIEFMMWIRTRCKRFPLHGNNLRAPVGPLARPCRPHCQSLCCQADKGNVRTCNQDTSLSSSVEDLVTIGDVESLLQSRYGPTSRSLADKTSYPKFGEHSCH
jgi:hypothetical protein